MKMNALSSRSSFEGTQLTKQISHVAKLIDREISCQRSLFSFLADNPKPNICCLNHRDIVATVTNRACFLTGVVLQKAHYICLKGVSTAVIPYDHNSKKKEG
eukprot:TRINITY_DN7994_c0_g1_i2.p2 TRINITY_DN7994_c0_g1~~TRINITY_DN7994_c0_g1_i2.p2  ORF type:complete len:102 (-),score=10.39 TRINITY_DN7994_c0_g1_i2:33-338(-)